MSFRRWLATVVPLLVRSVCPAIVRADTWAAPHTAVYNSANGTYRFTTIPPGEVGNPVVERDKARCLGRLQQKQKDGSYTTLWEKPLSNTVSPVSAVVSDSGKSVVTFDNWHHMGHGKNAVVLYGSEGKIIRELSLTDFLTQDEFFDLRRSVSSIWWGSGHVLDEKNGCVVLKVTRGEGIGNADKKEAKPPKEVRVRLEDGKVIEEKKESP
jgi:hypothetical protein